MERERLAPGALSIAGGAHERAFTSAEGAVEVQSQMSDMQRASRAISTSSSTSDTGVFATAGVSKAGREPVRTPLRPASGFSPVGGEAQKGSWEELSREREFDGETKNYSVPPELIALARANRKAREVGTLTPLAPKPVSEVPVVVPGPPRLSPDLRASERPSSPPPTPLSPLSPLAELMRAELAVARGAEPVEGAAGDPAIEVEAGQAALASSPLGDDLPTEDELAGMVESSGVRRSSRRARRSSRVELPAASSAAARAATIEPGRAKNYLPLALGAGIIAAYVALSYYANTLLGGLP